jgi:uncharacterized coiled-coil DUF342 family protein
MKNLENVDHSSLIEFNNRINSEINLLNTKFEKARKAILEQHSKIQPIENELLGNRADYFNVLEDVKSIREEFQKLSLVEDIEKFLEANIKEEFIKKAMGSIDEESIYNRIQVRYNEDIARLTDQVLDLSKRAYDLEYKNKSLENKIEKILNQNAMILETLKNISEKEGKNIANFFKSCYTRFVKLFS